MHSTISLNIQCFCGDCFCGTSGTTLIQEKHSSTASGPPSLEGRLTGRRGAVFIHSCGMIPYCLTADSIRNFVAIPYRLWRIISGTSRATTHPRKPLIHRKRSPELLCNSYLIGKANETSRRELRDVEAPSPTDNIGFRCATASNIFHTFTQSILKFIHLKQKRHGIFRAFFVNQSVTHAFSSRKGERRNPFHDFLG